MAAVELQLIIGRNVRRHRETLGLSQEAFAHDVLAVHRTYAGFLERGERNLTLSTVAWLAEKMEVEPYMLLMPSRDEDAA